MSGRMDGRTGRGRHRFGPRAEAVSDPGWRPAVAVGGGRRGNPPETRDTETFLDEKEKTFFKLGTALTQGN